MGRLVRADARRPGAARRGVQLDLHARRRADRPVGGRRDGADLRRAAGSHGLAAARGRAWRDDLRSGAGGLPADARRAGPRRKLRRPAPRAQRRRGAAGGGAVGLDRGDRQAALRGDGDVGDLDLRLLRAGAADRRRGDRLPAAGAAGRGARRRRRRAGAARQRRAARGVAPRPGADARLLAASRGDRRGLPRRVVRDRRPGGDARGRGDRVARPRRRSHQRRRLPGQPGGDRGGARRAPRRRRGGGGRARGPARRVDRRGLLRAGRRRRPPRRSSPPIARRGSRATSARAPSTRSRRCRARPTASCSGAG